MAKPEFPCLAEHDDLGAAQSEPEFMQVPNAQKLTQVNQKEQGFPIPLDVSHPCCLCRRFYWSKNACTDICIPYIVYKYPCGAPPADSPNAHGQGDRGSFR
jgi:hypothetical protein